MAPRNSRKLAAAAPTPTAAVAQPAKRRGRPSKSASIETFDNHAVAAAEHPAGAIVAANGALLPQTKGDAKSPAAQKAMNAAELVVAEHLPAIRKLLADDRTSDIALWEHVAALKSGNAHKSATGKDGKYPSFSAWLSAIITVDEYRAIAPMLAIAEYPDMRAAYTGHDFDGSPLSKRTCADIVRLWPDVPEKVATARSAAIAFVSRREERLFAVRVAQTLPRYAWDVFCNIARVNPTKQGSDGLPLMDLEALATEHMQALEKLTTRDACKVFLSNYHAQWLREAGNPANDVYLASIEAQIKTMSASIDGLIAKRDSLLAEVKTLKAEKAAAAAAQPAKRGRGRPRKSQ